MTIKPPADLATGSSTEDSRELPVADMFAAAGTAMLIVELGTARIAEANRAAGRLLGLQPADLIGRSWLAPFGSASAPALTEACARARAGTAATSVEVTGVAGTGTLLATLSMFRVATESYLLVHLNTPGAGVRPAPGQDSAAVLETLAESAAGLVITNAGLRIEYANDAFLAMVGVASPAELYGRSLAQWLDLTETDLLQLGAQMGQRQAATQVTTTLRGTAKPPRRIEVTAVAVPDDRDPRWGFMLHAGTATTHSTS